MGTDPAPRGAVRDATPANTRLCRNPQRASRRPPARRLELADSVAPPARFGQFLLCIGACRAISVARSGVRLARVDQRFAVQAIYCGGPRHFPAACSAGNYLDRQLAAPTQTQLDAPALAGLSGGTAGGSAFFLVEQARRQRPLCLFDHSCRVAGLPDRRPEPA